MKNISTVVVNFILVILMGFAVLGFLQSVFGLIWINDIQFQNERTYQLIRDIKEKSYFKINEEKKKLEDLELENFYLRRDIENLQRSIAQLQITIQNVQKENLKLNEIVEKLSSKMSEPKLFKRTISKEDVVEEYIEVTVTAYTACVEECGSNKGLTSSGTKVKQGVLSASKDLLTKWGYGARIYIPDMGVYILEDSTSRKLTNTLDVYMITKKQALEFGKKKIVVAKLKN